MSTASYREHAVIVANCFIFGGGLCAKRNWSSGESLLVSVGSLAPFPSAVTWQLCSRSPAENQITGREEPGFSSLAPLWAPGLHHQVWDAGFRLQFSKVLKLVGRCEHASFGSWGGGQKGRLWSAVGFWDLWTQASLLLLRVRPVGNWLRCVKGSLLMQPKWREQDCEGTRVWAVTCPA